jgi:mevalonate kinase
MTGSYANGAPQAMNGNGSTINGVLKDQPNGHNNSTTTPRPQPKHVTVVEPPNTNGTSASASNGIRRIPMHDRKLSNPLAPPFLVSAPGKTIVYGEHAVVHGKAAIAAAISLRSYMLVTTLSKSKRTVSLKFSDIGLDHTWNINELPWKAFNHPEKKKRYYDMVTSLDAELVEAMQPHIANVSPDASTEARKIHMSAASSFLYLFLSLGSENSPACVYALRSAIPIAAGLGSSASISVCISAALLIQVRALSGPHPDQMSHESEEQLERINRWAFVGELAIHGTPSGVDNTVATNGRAVLFQRKDYSKPPMVKILRDFPELPLLLVNTLQPKSTSAEVAKVAHLKARHPAVADAILDSIDAITRSVHECISDEDFDASNPDSIAYLGELMSVNHGLLTALGVSHPKLERLRYLVDQAGVGWTKLTGAGGGGCAITLLRQQPTSPTTSQNAQSAELNGAAAHEPSSSSLSKTESETETTPMETLISQLKAEGFERYETTLGGDGVGVLYPAIINDEEIHQDMFLTVQGREEVEALVAGRNDPGAWKFWRP